MKKVITAIGNEKLNIELKKEKNIEIITNDIQYKEGILEALEKYHDVDYLILNNSLQGNINLEELIIEINIINKKIKIIIVLENKNEELEKKLYQKNIYRILYNNEFEISELLKIIFEDNLKNEELKEEINKLKKIILEREQIQKEDIYKKERNKLKNKINNLLNYKLIKTKSKRKQFKNNIIKSAENNKKNNRKNNIKKNTQKIFCIIGPSGVGKSIITINLSKTFMYSNNKILIIDFDFSNNSIQTILGIKNNSKTNNKKVSTLEKNNSIFNNINNNLKLKNNSILNDNFNMNNNPESNNNIEINLKNLIDKNIININKKIDLLIINSEFINHKIKNGKEQINNKNNNYYFYSEIKEILNLLKKYNYILIDTNTNEIEINKTIIELSNKTFFISDTNLLEINKSIKLLDKYINKYNVNKNNFNILFNKYNSYSIDSKILSKIFNEFKIIGYLNYNEKYNQLINKNNKINFMNKKIRKEYLKISNYLIS